MGGLEEAQAQAEELAKTPKDVFSAAFPSARAQVCRNPRSVSEALGYRESEAFGTRESEAFGYRESEMPLLAQK